jgi:hypothetical protein
VIDVVYLSAVVVASWLGSRGSPVKIADPSTLPQQAVIR